MQKVKVETQQEDFGGKYNKSGGVFTNTNFIQSQLHTSEDQNIVCNTNIIWNTPRWAGLGNDPI